MILSVYMTYMFSRSYRQALRCIICTIKDNLQLTQLITHSLYIHMYIETIRMSTTNSTVNNYLRWEQVYKLYNNIVQHFCYYWDTLGSRLTTRLSRHVWTCMNVFQYSFEQRTFVTTRVVLTSTATPEMFQ